MKQKLEEIRANAARELAEAATPKRWKACASSILGKKVR